METTMSSAAEQRQKIELYDTTLRDGTQGEGISFSVEDKVNVAIRLDQFGIDFIEGGFPGSNPKDAEFFERIKDVQLIHAKVAAFGSTRRAHVAVEDDENLKALIRSGAKVATIFGKSWTFHVTDALRTTLDENLRMIEESVAFLRFHGMDVIYDAEHFFDGYFADREYALETLEAAVRGGASRVVLCDTNGGRLPHEVAEAVRAVRERIPAAIGIHTHNDSGLAVANALAAVREGAVHVQGTMNGYGERSGNCDLIQVIPNLQLKMGYACVPAESMPKLTELSRFVSELANMRPDPRQPFVGKSVFAHKGGAHVSAILRHPETYEHIPPEAVGNQRRVLVSELSGGSNIIYKAREYGVELKKDSPVLRKVTETIKELEHQGYHFEGAEASFELLLKRELGLYRPFFELLGLRVTIDKRHPEDEPVVEATIKVRVGERVLHTAADGNGPVNALDMALRKALEEAYPEIRRIKLVDYKVRVLNERAGTGAKVRVLITQSDGKKSWGTVGVSANIIEASWRALADGIEYGLIHVDATPMPLAQRAEAGGSA